MKRLIACLMVLAACSNGPAVTVPLGPGPTGTQSPLPTAPGEVFRPLQGLVLEQVASGLDRPVLLVAPPGDERLFIVEQPGRIRVVSDGVLLDEPFLDITSEVESGSLEQGLLGLAFHPRFADNGRFFVDFTNRAGDTVLAEYTAIPEADAAEKSSQRVLLHQEQPAPNHNGGMLEFGPAGFLYLGLGDGGGAGDQFGNGQRPQTLLGAILRLDVDAASPYAIPPSNPFVGGGGAPEVWAFGLRNPWRFAIDATSAALFVGDVGQAEHEEIDIVPLDAGGSNLGWPLLEGDACFASSDCDQQGTLRPVVTYGHDQGCSIIGGYVYRGAQIPEWWGHFLFSDWCGGWVRSIFADGGDMTATEWGIDTSLLGQVLSFGRDGDGELYLLGSSGVVARITPTR